MNNTPKQTHTGSEKDNKTNNDTGSEKAKASKTKKSKYDGLSRSDLIELSSTDSKVSKLISKKGVSWLLKKQVKYLSQLPQPAQLSPEWFTLRHQMITATTAGPALHKSHYTSYKDALMKKCNIGPKFTGNDATRWGQKYEQVATEIYEHKKKVSVEEFGLVQHQHISWLGASPDGITKDGVMLEIKCPPSRKITGVVPPHYWIQMQIQLECCDLEMCHFEECRFKEVGQEEYMTTDEEYKGIVYEIVDKDTCNNYYIYPPLFVNYDEWFMDWFTAEMESNRNFIFTHEINQAYWILEKYSQVEVPRDRDWFSMSKPKLDAFWKHVIHYRDNLKDLLETDFPNPYKRKRRVAKPVAKPVVVSSASDDDDDDDSSSASGGKTTKKGLVSTNMTNLENGSGMSEYLLKQAAKTSASRKKKPAKRKPKARPKCSFVLSD